jgi:hypothetical protein
MGKEGFHLLCLALGILDSVEESYNGPYPWRWIKLYVIIALLEVEPWVGFNLKKFARIE